ncbi:MAG: Ppx/GppA phosphatase family protein [Bdellovibrionales bacterium]
MDLTKNIAIIDLGTNSVRFEIFHISSNFEIHKVFYMKRMIRLGEGIYSGKQLQELAVARAEKAFTDFLEESKNIPIHETLAYATCALRSVNDASAFLARIYQKFKIQLEVISGEREALLIGKGIVKNEIMPNHASILIDIGGGSTEFILTHKNQIIDYCSTELGCNRLWQRFLQSDLDHTKQTEEMRTYVQETLSNLRRERQWPQVRSMIGSSGTVKTISKVLRKRDKLSSPMLIEDLKDLSRELLPLEKEEIKEVPGLPERRVDLIQSGLLVLVEAAKEFEAEVVQSSEFNMRSGMIEWAVEQSIKRRS